MYVILPPDMGVVDYEPTIFTKYEHLDDLIGSVKEAGFDVYAGLKAWAKGRDAYYYIYKGMLHGSPYRNSESKTIYMFEDLFNDHVDDCSSFLDLL